MHKRAFIIGGHQLEYRGMNCKRKQGSITSYFTKKSRPASKLHKEACQFTGIP